MTTWGKYVYPHASGEVWEFGPDVEFGGENGQENREKFVSIKTKQKAL